MNRQEINAKLRASYPMKHRWHNRFHLEMPFGLLNDPNGLSFYQGEYHIFYQWNPLCCEHKNKCWAHVHTRDFVNYSIPELALWPTDAYDQDGCYSGCAFKEGDALRVIYTGNVRNPEGERISSQRLGTLLEDGMVRKDDLLLAGPPEGYTAHFRDPYFFRRQGRQYLLLGAQTVDERGCVLLYVRAEDGRWQFCGEVRTQLGRFGYMWECPNLLQFGSHDVLVFCPQGVTAQEFAYQNRYEAGYVAGHLATEKPEMLHGPFEELDHGFDFYAPQVFRHEGRNVLLGWMGMPDEEAFYPTAEAGWLYTLTMPRVLTFRSGHIYAAPAPELEALRIVDSVVELEEHAVSGLAVPLGDGAEILLDIELGAASRLTFELVYGLESVRLVYDRRRQLMQIDRMGMQLGARGVRTFHLAARDSFALHLFVDKTAVEAFFQHGEQTASFLVFPEKNILPELTLHTDKAFTELTGSVWNLDGFAYTME